MTTVAVPVHIPGFTDPDENGRRQRAFSFGRTVIDDRARNEERRGVIANVNRDGTYDVAWLGVAEPERNVHPAVLMHAPEATPVFESVDAFMRSGIVADGQRVIVIAGITERRGQSFGGGSSTLDRWELRVCEGLGFGRTIAIVEVGRTPFLVDVNANLGPSGQRSVRLSDLERFAFMCRLAAARNRR